MQKDAKKNNIYLCMNNNEQKNIGEAHYISQWKVIF